MDWHKTIMDSDRNPLRDLPPVQRFQIMVVLSMMWTAIFCAGASLWLWYGEIVAVHILAALGILITGMTFRTAANTKTYRDHPVRDGTARYDDIWGG